jgi:hypothetical protein
VPPEGPGTSLEDSHGKTQGHKRAADALAALTRVDGKQYTCRATAFFMNSDETNGRHIGISSLKGCAALN